jgi:hypothetical protein
MSHDRAHKHGHHHGHDRAHDHATLARFHAGHDHGRRRILAAGAALPIALVAGRALAERFIDEVGVRAGAFLALLDAGQRRDAAYAFDAPQRFDWHYVPRSRPGLPLKAMTRPQRDAAEMLLRAVLSEEGYRRVEGVRLILENILRGDSTSSFRDPENYALAIFGRPGAFPWAFRFEGHHLSLTFSFPAPDRASATPSFWGANPAEVRRGQHQGFRLLGAQTDAAFALVRSLDPTQRGEAMIAERSLGDVVAGPGRADALKAPRGVVFARLAEAQRNQAIAVIEGMMAPLHPEFRTQQARRLREAGLEGLRFAWAGATDAKGAYYFRLHGPITLVEFDNTQDDANHIHSLWRDLAADWGDDTLAAHYRSGHRP